MATYSRAQLRDAVLRELGVIDAQGAPSPEDAVLANDRCQQQMEFLYDQGYIPFDLDGDKIPGRYFIPITNVVAFHLILPYGVTGRTQLLTQNAIVGMKDLARLKAKRYLGNVQKAEYF